MRGTRRGISDTWASGDWDARSRLRRFHFDALRTPLFNLTNATAGTRGRIVYGLVFCLAMAATGTLGFVVAPGVSKPQEREFTVVTTKYAYEPAVIRVNKGDTVRLRFASPDVVHGFYLEGHGIDVKIYPMRANFPTDGLIVEGRTKVNEAMLTGESKPVEKGEPVDDLKSPPARSVVVSTNLLKISSPWHRTQPRAGV